MSESPCRWRSLLSHRLSVSKTTLPRGPRGHFRRPTRSPGGGVYAAGALPVGGSRPLAGWRRVRPPSSSLLHASALDSRASASGFSTCAPRSIPRSVF
ncbi:hypothetical protein VULLAG_LOCUS8593 [Vulpes lagopus]